jgi:hypothetical protein
MKIEITIKGNYSDGDRFSVTCSTIEDAIAELEMIEVNEHAFDSNLKNRNDE